ncbi:MAG: hypothetical protein ABI353_20490 [Isosphaeraceae bacterium]
MRDRWIAGALAALLLAVAPGGFGCVSTSVRQVSPNPLLVPSADFEAVWKQAVTVTNEYFDISSENRLAGLIVTQPKVAATLLEPWHGDTVGFDQRLEATLQSIRRFAKVYVNQAPGGGYAVKVEVYKELEDLVKPDRQMGGRAVFADQLPVNRAREVVGPVPVPVGWIPQGRDTKLEQAILARLREGLFL